MTITIETDVVVIGAGITAAMFVERLAENTDAAITGSISRVGIAISFPLEGLEGKWGG